MTTQEKYLRACRVIQRINDQRAAWGNCLTQEGQDGLDICLRAMASDLVEARAELMAKGR